MTQQLTSSIPAVLDALDDGFTELLATRGVNGDEILVCQGECPDPPKEYLEIGDVVGNADQQWAHLGALTRDETYAVSITIVVQDDRHTTQRAAKDRAFEILGFCETWLRENVTLGLTQTSGQFQRLEVQVATIGTLGEPAERGWRYVIGWAVKIDSRLRGIR